MDGIYKYDTNRHVATFNYANWTTQAEYEARRAAERQRERAGSPPVPYRPYVVTYTYTAEGIEIKE